MTAELFDGPYGGRVYLIGTGATMLIFPMAYRSGLFERRYRLWGVSKETDRAMFKHDGLRRLAPLMSDREKSLNPERFPQ